MRRGRDERKREGHGGGGALQSRNGQNGQRKKNTDLGGIPIELADITDKLLVHTLLIYERVGKVKWKERVRGRGREESKE